MIDVEDQIGIEVQDALLAEHTADPSFPNTIDVTNVYVKAPATLPHVSIIETDNYMDRDSMNSDGEVLGVLTYEVNVYSALQTGRKREARRIMNVVDKAMTRMNFRRIAMQPVDNLMDATVYRIFARYQANVDKLGTLYRR